MKTKPIHEIRLGAVRAAVWKNEAETGARFNVTLSRIYCDGDEWKSIGSFRRDDLLIVGKVAGLAYEWIRVQNQEQIDRMNLQAKQYEPMQFSFFLEHDQELIDTLNFIYKHMGPFNSIEGETKG